MNRCETKAADEIELDSDYWHRLALDASIKSIKYATISIILSSIAIIAGGSVLLSLTWRR